MTTWRVPRDTAANLASATPLEGEILFDTTNDELRIGDGATAGGVALAKKNASAATVTATGGSTARSLADWFKGVERGTVAPPAEVGWWTNDATPGVPWKTRERFFVGDAADIPGMKSPGSSADKTWVGNTSGGLMTYFETRSQAAVFSNKGAIGGSFASRSSDNVESGERNTIGVGAFAYNDNTNASDKKSAWAFYGHAAQTQANQFTTVLELDACSTVVLAGITPYTMGATGAVATAWLGVGGEIAQGLVDIGSGASITNISALLGFVNTETGASGNRAAKGIVFQSNVLAGTDGDGTGTGRAIEMARNHEIAWMFSSGANAVAGLIRGDNDTGATQTRLIYNSSGFDVRGVKSDLTTEVNYFRVNSLTMSGTNDTNYLLLTPTQTGGGAVTLAAIGIDSNITLRLNAKGTGAVTTQSYSLGVGTASPDVRLHSEIDDSNTNTASFPLRITHTTSGTPAAGIGVGMQFEVETADGNNEIGGALEVSTSDVSAGSEDFDFVLKLMAAGATAAERFRIRSTGDPVWKPQATATALTNNGEVTMELTNNTTLTFKARGSDGTTRSGTITLS